MKLKRGMKLKSKNSGVVIKLINKASGNNHWNCNQVNRKKSHKVHEGTLRKFYEPLL
jgi:hypothetical protein